MESLAFNLAERLLARFASLAYQELSLAVSVKVELDKLKTTLETITLVLQDAERKQMMNPLITHWLRKLNDVCNDADDVLDDFEYQERRMQVVNRGDLKGKVRNIFSSRSSPSLFRNKMGHRIKDIMERLDQIAIEKERYSLVARDFCGDSQLLCKEVRDETCSHIQVSDVIGRDDEANQIIAHLLKSIQGVDNLSVISVVGLGGVGKTTLAKLVYNDKRVVEEFGLKMWVCISDEFLTKRLLGEMINLASVQNWDINESLPLMKFRLRNGVAGKKFLLVLDDVWDKEPVGVTTEKWDEFKNLLDVGGRGSKILITTRSQSVATLGGSTYVHYLEGLPHDDCMSLFKKMAFIKEGEERQDQSLMVIATDIVKKCGGVPLALATVGSSLRWKRNLTDWLQVRDNNIWKEEGILPALRLSYNALPPYLKPCFAYCALFPKDFIFNSQVVIPMWTTQGYLQPSDGKQGLYEIGLDYVRQLCSRSLFQIFEDELPYLYVEFKMHDLVHDLAISVAQTECSSLNCRPSDTSKRIRHISLSSKDLSEKDEQVRQSILQLDKVQTLVMRQECEVGLFLKLASRNSFICGF